MRGLARKLFFSMVPATLLAVGGLAAGEYWARSQQTTFNPRALMPSPLSDPGDNPFKKCFEPHVTRGYSPIPNTCGRNDLGLYVHGVGQGVPDAPEHVLVLGDSIADQRVWVEAAVEAAQDSIPALVAFNGGIAGYDSCGELQVFKEVVDELQPDTVVVQFCLNDYAVAANAVALPGGRTRMWAGSRVHEFPSWVMHSRLLLYVALSQGWWVAGSDPMGITAASDAEECLLGFRDEAAARGMGFGVVLFPAFYSDVDTDEFHVGIDREGWTIRDAEARIEGFLDAQDIDYVPLRPLLESRGALESQRAAPDDPWHPDLRTQHAIGAHIAPWLVTLHQAERGPPGP